MTIRARWMILALALIGLGFATSSSWVHYRLLTDASYVSPCDLNATFNCSQVYMSPYGSVAGVPVALGGVFWFAVAALVAAFAAPEKSSASGAYLFAWSTVGLAVVFYLGYASFVVLKSACILCLGTYAAVIGIFIVSGSLSSIPMSHIPSRLFGDLRKALLRPAAVTATVLLLGGSVSAVMLFPKEGSRPEPQVTPPSPEQSKNFADAWAQQPRVDLGIAAGGAKVVIVKFNDYQCPGCRETHNWYKPILAKYEKSHPGAVKYVLKDWPWHSKCNFNTQTTMHGGACEAAAAVRMARDRSKAKADEMETWLYDNIATLSPATVKAAAERIVGVKDFDKEYAAKVAEIRKDVADGGALSIKSTPTLFINGVRIEQLMPAAYFDLAIQLELSKAGVK